MREAEAAVHHRHAVRQRALGRRQTVLLRQAVAVVVRRERGRWHLREGGMKTKPQSAPRATATRASGPKIG